MTLLSLAIVIVVVGVLLWAVNEFIPMEGRIKNLLNIVVVVFVLLWILVQFGLISGLGNMTLK